MTATYHNVRLLGRMPSLRGKPPHFTVGGQPAERVVSLLVYTDPESGLIHIVLAIEYLMDDRPPEGDCIGMYPFSQGREAHEDAMKVAAELGYRYRRASTGVGWEWVDARVMVGLGDGPELTIGG